MKIYLDIFFLVNMGMNFFVLALLSFFQNQPVRGKRLAAASALGALAAVLWVVLGIPGGPLSLLSGLLGNALWVRLAFGKSAPSAWIRNTAMFYLASFFLSGALRYLQGTMGIQGKWAFLMPASGAVTYGAFRFFSAWRGQLDRQREYILCTLRYGGKPEGAGASGHGKPSGGAIWETAGDHREQGLFGKSVAGRGAAIPLYSLSYRGDGAGYDAGLPGGEPGA